MPPDLTNPCVKEASLYEQLSNDRVKCGTCERRCVIPLGERGFCKTRQNIDGKLYTLVYGDISSISVNPIEKRSRISPTPLDKAILPFLAWKPSLNRRNLELQLYLPLVPELVDKQIRA